jgi:hypothetical protein
MFNRARYHRVCDTSNSASSIVLSIGETWRERVLRGVVSLEPSASLVEGTELNRNAGTNTNKGG